MALEAPGRVAVLGPSGAGKSTLLSAIAGFLAPAFGRILWQGRDLEPLAPAARPLTMIFQDQNLFPHLSLLQNLELGLGRRGRFGAGNGDRVLTILRRVGLEGLGGRRPAELSGGQASRAVLARALLRDRALVLMDEPFSALGPALRDEMLDLVAEMLAGALVLMITHDPADARRWAERVIFVDQGRAIGPFPAEILADPPREIAAYLGRR